MPKTNIIPINRKASYRNDPYLPLSRQPTIRTQNFLDFWRNNWDAVYKNTRSSHPGIGITVCCYLSVRIILLYFCFKEYDISTTEENIKPFLELTSSITHRHKTMPLEDWRTLESFQNYMTRRNIPLPDCAQFINQVSNQQDLRIDTNLEILTSDKLTPNNYYIGVIMLDNEAAHWFVYYLSSISGQINILSTWGSEKWGIPLLHNIITFYNWDLFINNINQVDNPTVNTDLFETLFLNSEKAVPLRSDEIEGVLTKEQVQEEIKTELLVYTPGRVKIYSVFPYYYECLKQVVLQFKEHLKTGRGSSITNKNKTRKLRRNERITRAKRRRRRNQSRK